MTRRAVVAIGIVLTTVAVGLVAGASARTSGDVVIKTLATRADRVSGGDALVEIVLPRGGSAKGLAVDVGGRDVSRAFARRGVGPMRGRIVGKLTDLAQGRNVVTARLPDGRGARLAITNHPRGGPMFSGRQIQPWPCAEGAADKQCNRKTTYEFSYMPQGGGALVPYDTQNPPPDVAQTTTDQGKTVPYIVRSEVGTLNRSQYRIAVLFDPDKEFTPWSTQAWNHKLVITHGAGCDTTYGEQQAPDVLNTTAPARGFAVMSHALDHNTMSCNVVTQGESLAMTKEQLVDHYGEIRYTIGTGCSGGAVTQYQVANAYPGMYQGITPACSFPDSWTSRMLYEDYSILRRYFEEPQRWAPGVAWAVKDLEAVWGHPNPANARVYNTAIAPVIDPSRSCPGVPAEQVYDAQDNPKGVRCSLQDYMVNVFGRRKSDGFAGKPWDNVGVQYGLRGLLAGKISREQFVDLNVKVGSRDIDYEPQDRRASADVLALKAAYRSGAFNQANNLDETAIIDLRGPDPGAFHDVYRVYATRARLVREHGDAGNQLIWRGLVAIQGDGTFTSDAIVAMDEWLAAVEKDKRDIPLARKIVLDRPASVQDRCTNGAGVDIDPRVCDQAVAPYSTARIEAGMPYTDDIIKCHTKPHRRADYFPVRFTDEQWSALEEVFATGVCDYSKPGVGQQDTIPWATFATGPGGRDAGPAPASKAIE